MISHNGFVPAAPGRLDHRGIQIDPESGDAALAQKV
jgi:hypothetical protein